MHQERLYSLDLLRFIAATSVMLFHYLFRGYITNDLSTLRFDELAGVFKYFHLGVDVFFIISGFVISMSLKGTSSVTSFIVSRITRLYPAYWFCVLLTFCIIHFFGSPVFSVSNMQLAVNLTMLQSFFRVDMIDGVYWSLYIELKFYILIAVALVVQKKYPISLVQVSYVWLVVTIVYAFLPTGNVSSVLNFIFICNWSSYFIAGILFFEIYKAGATLSSVLGIVISFFLSIYFSSIRISEASNFYGVGFSMGIVVVVIGVFYGIMLLLSLGMLTSLNSKSFLRLGSMTYPLYLIHENIGFIIFNHFGTPENKYMVFSLTSAGMIVLSFFIHQKIEKPFAHVLKPSLISVMQRIVK